MFIEKLFPWVLPRMVFEIRHHIPYNSMNNRKIIPPLTLIYIHVPLDMLDFFFLARNNLTSLIMIFFRAILMCNVHPCRFSTRSLQLYMLSTVDLITEHLPKETVSFRALQCINYFLKVTLNFILTIKF